MSYYIRIEPHTHFREAIYKTRRDGYITYNYWGMVKVCEKLYEMNTEDAIEWVEYNILGLNDSNEGMFGVRYASPRVRRKVGTRKKRAR